MFFKQFYDEDLAQASYLIGCQATGEAIVVDARRDIHIYRDEAARKGLRITHVTETHIHADYLSGSRELAHATGASLYLSDEGDADWKYQFESHKLHHDDVITLGNIHVKAVHTPGHTPEHLSFLITDGATTNEAGFFLTGDFVFVGDVGRPDLLDEAAGGVDTRFVGAKQLFASLRDHFLTLPDYVQVWSGHGAGSACGKALGAVPSTTVGYERKVAWWASYLKDNDEAGFTKELLAGQPDAPQYFGRMKKENKAGPALLEQRPTFKTYSAEEVQAGLADRSVRFVDTRVRASYLNNHVPRSLFIPWGTSFATYGAYAIVPENDPRPIVVLAHDESMAEAMRDRLSYVGIDNVVGYVSSLEGFTLESVPTISLEDFEHSTRYILDVRTANEYQAGHIPKAHQLHTGRVAYQLDAIPKEPLVVHCQMGGRASVAASILREAGYEDVLELEGSYAAWQKAQQEAQ